LLLNKRYSNRWQGLISFLYSNSSGFGRRSLRQDINVEGPMFWDDNWMSSLNQTINNLDGSLPFTPKYEVKLSGSYTIPRIEVDLGTRIRFHSGRALWKIDNAYPQHTPFGDPPGGVIEPGGSLGQIVAIDPNNPDYLPNSTLFDLHVEKAIVLTGTNKLHLVLDGFNVFNASTATDADPTFEYGKITAIVAPRWFRFGARWEF
jgi:hypothetical protein